MQAHIRVAERVAQSLWEQIGALVGHGAQPREGAASWAGDGELLVHDLGPPGLPRAGQFAFRIETAADDPPPCGGHAYLCDPHRSALRFVCGRAELIDAQCRVVAAWPLPRPDVPPSPAWIDAPWAGRPERSPPCFLPTAPASLLRRLLLLTGTAPRVGRASVCDRGDAVVVHYMRPACNETDHAGDVAADFLLYVPATTDPWCGAAAVCEALCAWGIMPDVWHVVCVPWALVAFRWGSSPGRADRVLLRNDLCLALQDPVNPQGIAALGRHGLQAWSVELGPLVNKPPEHPGKKRR